MRTETEFFAQAAAYLDVFVRSYPRWHSRLKTRGKVMLYLLLFARCRLQPAHFTEYFCIQEGLLKLRKKKQRLPKEVVLTLIERLKANPEESDKDPWFWYCNNYPDSHVYETVIASFEAHQVAFQPRVARALAQAVDNTVYDVIQMLNAELRKHHERGSFTQARLRRLLQTVYDPEHPHLSEH